MFRARCPEVNRSAGQQDLDATSQVLGDKPYVLRDECTVIDATVFGTVSSVIGETFDTPLLTHAKDKANLVAYRIRCMERLCPVDDG